MARRKKADRLTVAKTFVTNGRVYHRGSTVAGNDKVVQGREHLFNGVDKVEQATAAPGEKRSVTVPEKEEPKAEPEKEEPKEEKAEEQPEA